MKKLRVEVNEADIEEAIKDGSHDDSSWCPIARAVRRMPEFEFSEIEVGYNGLQIDSAEFWLPDLAIEFIQLFDGGSKVRPIAFEAEELVI